MRTDRRRLSRALLALLAVLALVSAACGTDDPDPGAATTDGADGAGDDGTDDGTDDEPQSGGRLVALHSSEVRGLAPVEGVGSAGGGDMHRMFALYGAVVYTDSATGEVVPHMVESFEPDETAQVWTIKLREGVTFTDGTPFDAEAIKVNWERHTDPEAGSPYGAVVTQAETLEVVDDLTLVAHLAAPNALWSSEVARGVPYIASPTALEELGEDYNTAPVGAGPFTLKEWVRDSHMVLERNPDYWDAPRPYLDELEWRVVAEDQQRLNTWDSGAADVFYTSDAVTLRAARDAGADETVVEMIGGGTLQFNLELEMWDDVRVRRAIAHAINLDEMHERVFEGIIEPPETYFADYSPFHNPEENQLHEHDPELAQQLMDEYLADTGQEEFSFTWTVTNNAQSLAASQVYQAQINAIDGLNVELDPVETVQLVTQIIERNNEAINMSYRGVAPEPEFNQLVVCDGPRNFSGYCSEAVDEAIAIARTSPDVEEQAAAYVTAIDHLQEDIPWLLYDRDSTVAFYSDHVRDYAGFEDNGMLSDRIWVQQ